MKGYLDIPMSIYYKNCKYCGARPIIAPAGNEGYVVKCPSNESHYKTKSGLIDIEDWNAHNSSAYEDGFNISTGSNG